MVERTDPPQPTDKQMEIDGWPMARPVTAASDKRLSWPRLPEVKLPPLPKLPNVQPPKLNIQPPKLPALPQVKLPAMPQVQMPAMPQVKLPEVKWPEVKLPNLNPFQPIQDTVSGTLDRVKRGLVILVVVVAIVMVIGLIVFAWWWHKHKQERKEAGKLVIQTATDFGRQYSSGQAEAAKSVLPLISKGMV